MCIHGGAECTGCMMCREDDGPAVLYANRCGMSSSRREDLKEAKNTKVVRSMTNKEIQK